MYLVSERGKLTRINQTLIDSTLDEVPRWTLIKDVPTGNHQTNNLDVMPNGTVIWHVGSTCNICDEADERNAALLWVNSSTGEHGVLASGVRNSFHGTWVPDMGYLFSDNGRDWEGNHPPEEINLLIPGEDYGWPEGCTSSQLNLIQFLYSKKLIGPIPVSYTHLTLPTKRIV